MPEPSPTEGPSAPRGSRASCVRGNPRGRHTASQHLWIQAGSRSRTAVFRRDLIQVNKSPGLLPLGPKQFPLAALSIPGASDTKGCCWASSKSWKRDGTSVCSAPASPRHPAALCPSPQHGRRRGWLLWANTAALTGGPGQSRPQQTPAAQCSQPEALQEGNAAQSCVL